MSYNSKTVMFASLQKGGNLQVRELVDFPGIIISDQQDTRSSPWVRTISFEGAEFLTIAGAIEAWKAAKDPNPLDYEGTLPNARLKRGDDK